MENDRKIVEGFEYWTQNEEDGVCHIPSNLCRRVLELLKNSKRVTRCKDCKYYDYGLCDNVPKNMPPRPKEPQFFCADGKRR